jgi:hypothetical protein
MNALDDAVTAISHELLKLSKQRNDVDYEALPLDKLEARIHDVLMGLSGETLNILKQSTMKSGLKQSQDEAECCSTCLMPIAECHREDVAARWHKEDMDLFCSCCGRFWKGTITELSRAREFMDNE